jgi:hypothetical protein
MCTLRPIPMLANTTSRAQPRIEKNPALVMEGRKKKRVGWLSKECNLSRGSSHKQTLIIGKLR